MFFDEKLWKELGLTIVGIWGLFGAVLGYLLSLIQWHVVWIIFIVGSWELIDLFILGIILHFFNIDRSELPPKENKSKIVLEAPTIPEPEPVSVPETEEVVPPV